MKYIIKIQTQVKKDDEPVTDNEVNNIDDEEERGDVGMDMEQQQRNIDALKESE